MGLARPLECRCDRGKGGHTFARHRKCDGGYSVCQGLKGGQRPYPGREAISLEPMVLVLGRVKRVSGVKPTSHSRPLVVLRIGLLSLCRVSRVHL